MRVKFVGCEHITIASLSLTHTVGHSGNGTQEVLFVGKHDCGVEACPVPHTGNFVRSLKDVESEMAKKGDLFWVRHRQSKDKDRYCVTRAGRTVTLDMPTEGKKKMG